MQPPATKTQYDTASSLDGFVATPDHDLAWLTQFGDVGSSYEAFYRGVGAVAMGSSTYAWVLRHHVRPAGAAPKPWPYDVPTWVFSATPYGAAWVELRYEVPMARA